MPYRHCHILTVFGFDRTAGFCESVPLRNFALWILDPYGMSFGWAHECSASICWVIGMNGAARMKTVPFLGLIVDITREPHCATLIFSLPNALQRHLS